MMTNQTSRRRFLLESGLTIGALSTGTWNGLAQDPVRATDTSVKMKTADELITPKTERAIERALDFLAKTQTKTGNRRGSFGASGTDGSAGIAGIAGLAFLCHGSVPGRGRYGKQVANCLDFVLGSMQRSGYISRPGNGYGNMYSHGFATLFLSQVYGMTRKKVLKEKLRSAVDLILYAQNKEGGWRYSPTPTGADLSITVCQIMALRGARDAGINVPDSVRDKAIKYVKKSQVAGGGFNYTLTGGHQTMPLTAAGVVSLYSAGIYEGKEITNGLAYIKNNRSGSSYYYYGNYYAVQAMWHAGGKYWNDWYPRIREELLKRQQSNGSFSDSHGVAYATAMAGIILQMPKDIVPVFAR